jgi:hypothetical protein
MTSTLEHMAVVGRRVTFTYHRHLGGGPAYPGIITGTEPAVNGALLARVRLDGTRSTLTPPVDYEGLRYLDEVVPVPELPMGRFTPERSDANGFWEKEGVLLATIGEDGEDLVIIADDRDKAIAAATAYVREVQVDLDYVAFDDIRAHWAVFEWEPEDAESPWTVRAAEQGEAHAIHTYCLDA